MSVAQRVIGPGLTGGVTTAATQAMAVVPAPYDSMLSAQPAANIKAFVTFPATAGRSWMISEVSFFMVTIGVSASIPMGLSVTDGANTLWLSGMTLPAGSAILAVSSAVYLTNLGLLGAVGHAVVVGYDNAPGANIYERVAAAAYLI